jgi:hypothetical protein
MAWTRFHPLTRILVVAGTIIGLALLSGGERVGEAVAHFSPGGSFADRCDALGAAEIDVSYVPTPLVENRRLGVEALTRLSESTTPDQRTVGLTRAHFGHRAQVDLKGIEDRRGARACIRPEVRVEVFLAPLTVYVASEYAGDPCRAQAIREHEQKHVATYEAYVHEALPRLRGELARALGSTAAQGDSIEEARHRIDRQLNRALAEFMQQSERTLAQRQAAIDTPAEYERLRLACAS